MSAEAPATPATPAPAAAAAPAAPAAAPAAPNPSPRTPVAPPVGSDAAHLAHAKTIFAPDPAKATPAPAAAAAPAEAKKPDAAPAKSDTPPPEVFPEDKLTEPTTETAKAGWRELKTLTKTLRNEKLALESQLAEARKAPASAANTADIEGIKAQLQALETEKKAMSDRLLILDLQNHPDFVRQYKEPVQKSFAESAQLLADNGVTEKIDLNAMLSKPRAEFAKQVSELASKMNAFDAQTFTANMRQAFQLKGQEAEALAKAGDVHAQLQQKAQMAQRQAFDSVSKEVTTAIAKLEVKPDMSPEDRAAVEAYNQSVDSIRTEAEAKAFGKVTEKDVAEMAYNNALLGHFAKHVVPKLERHVQSQNQVIADLTAQLKALQGGKAPSPGGQAAPQQSAPQNESIEASARRVWRRGA